MIVGEWGDLKEELDLDTEYFLHHSTFKACPPFLKFCWLGSPFSILAYLYCCTVAPKSIHSMTYLSKIRTRTMLLGLVITNCGLSYCIMCHTGLFTMHYALWSHFTLPHSGIQKILCSMRFMHYDHMHYEIMYCMW